MRNVCGSAGVFSGSRECPAPDVRDRPSYDSCCGSSSGSVVAASARGHVSRLKSLDYPIEQPPTGESGTTRAPAGLAIVAARGTSKIIDLKAPPQTDPFRLASQYHEKSIKRKEILRGNEDEFPLYRKLQQLTEISTDKRVKTNRVQMMEHLKKVREIYGDCDSEEPGVATSIREINGATADDFRHGHPTDERFCMYAAVNALNHELWIISQNHANVIVACENPELICCAL